MICDTSCEHCVGTGVVIFTHYDNEITAECPDLKQLQEETYANY